MAANESSIYVDVIDSGCFNIGKFTSIMHKVPIVVEIAGA